ncbi:MAG: hypothetical protein H7A51_17990 [Akkermansiaceae bacterium]|nr:hypothetical protein [Akkermansiaceae bacterium]
MKYTTITTLAALLLGSAGAIAQTTAYTKPSGFVTHTLKAGKFNLIGLTLHSPIAISGAFETVSGTTLTDTNVDFTSVLTTGNTYILEITENTADPSLVGTIQEITSWTATTLTTPDDLGSDGLAGETTSGANNGAKYQLRKAPTLEEVFGTTNSVLQKGVISTLADILWIPNLSGGYDRYFLSNTNQWKNAATNAVAPNVPLVYTDALFIQRKGAEVNLVLTGSVKANNTVVALSTGFNPVSIVAPVGATLQNSGLNASLQAGVISTLADIVWVPNGSGEYDRYFYHTSNVWRNATTNADVVGDVVLPHGIFIQRKGASKNATLTTPSGYSNL